jgi:hypothetical protein
MLVGQRRDSAIGSGGQLCGGKISERSRYGRLAVRCDLEKHELACVARDYRMQTVLQSEIGDGGAGVRDVMDKGKASQNRR